MSICSWQSHFSWQRLFSDQTVEAPQCYNRAFSVCQGLVSVSRRVTWRIAFHAVSKCSQEDVALQLWEEGCFSQKERKLACALARWRALAPPRAPLLTKELQSKRWNAAWSLLVEPGKRKMNLALSLLTKMQRKGYEAPAFSYNVLMNLTGESDAISPCDCFSPCKTTDRNPLWSATIRSWNHLQERETLPLKTSWGNEVCGSVSWPSNVCLTSFCSHQ